ncbi:FAD:protein FMN transferase [Solihabitans fulvus]|uniref:FAD:protein FMN transferase n=1 Tax=Solihabitans fulvus TaxID=1892852 RepID=A0A5B2XF88_9PSEU|nr:FAD:protein FMN transferase [Solihabitans fulvus]KAA2261729.1 FAD:protein FMN transferase [Solihabitans fulvus]
MTESRGAWVEQIMGMPISVHLRGPQVPGERPEAVERVFDELRRVDRIFSTHRADSQISQLADGLRDLSDCDQQVTEVLALCDTARELTEGWFDALLPTGDGALRLDPTGLVKGWAVERAVAALAEDWPGDYYVNAGGDLALGSRSGQPWRVGIEDPQTGGVLAVVPLATGGIATSGTAHRGEHILLPSTGAPATELRSITVVGPSLLWADVFATAAFARGATGVAWVHELAGYEALAVGRDGTRTLTDGMRAILEAPQTV